MSLGGITKLQKSLFSHIFLCQSLGSMLRTALDITYTSIDEKTGF